MKNWPQISAIDTKSLNELTLALHLASQYVGAAGLYLLPEESDNSQTSLHWDSHRKWLVGKLLPAKQPLKLALNTDGNVLLLVDDRHHILYDFELTGNAFSDGTHWMKAVLTHYAVYAAHIQVAWDSVLAHRRFLGDNVFPLFLPEEYDAFYAVRSMAETLLQHYRAQFSHASPVQNWTHHPSMKTELSLMKIKDRSPHFISLGFSGKDQGSSEAFFYARSKEKAESKLKLSAVINGTNSPLQQQQMLLDFMDQGIAHL